MRCRNCGEEIPDKALVCGKCGTPVREEDRPENAFDSERENAGHNDPAEDRNPEGSYDRGTDHAQNAGSSRNWYETNGQTSGSVRREESEMNGRIPYSGRQEYRQSAGGYSDYRSTADSAETQLTGKEGLAKAGLILGAVSIPLILFPMVSVVTSVAAILLGILGLDSFKKKQAVTAIVLGIVMLLFSMTLLVALAIVSPYMEELSQVFTEAMQ